MADTSKLEATVGYLAQKISPGKLKLFKLLFLADFESYAATGQSITNERYENWEMGPVPVTLWKHFTSITSRCADIELVETGAIPEQRLNHKRGYTPGLSIEERTYLDSVIDRFGDMSGNDLKRHTHQTLPYRATKNGEEIPYALAAYLDYRKPSRQAVDALLRDQQLLSDLRAALEASA